MNFLKTNSEVLMPKCSDLLADKLKQIELKHELLNGQIKVPSLKNLCRRYLNKYSEERNEAGNSSSSGTAITTNNEINNNHSALGANFIYFKLFKLNKNFNLELINFLTFDLIDDLYGKQIELDKFSF